MKNDLQPGVNVEENPLTKALEIQTERVLNALEVAMLQAMNDVRATFGDLSNADEAVFAAKLQAEVARNALRRHVVLVGELSDLGDTKRVELAITDAGKYFREFVDKYAPLKVIKLGQ